MDVKIEGLDPFRNVTLVLSTLEAAMLRRALLTASGNGWPLTPQDAARCNDIADLLAALLKKRRVAATVKLLDRRF